MNEGKVAQVIGAVVDVEFEDKLPEILNGITIDQPGDKEKGNPDIKITLEVASHLGENVVRTIAMSATDGLVRGTLAIDTGLPITVPVGEKTLGRIMNVTGDPIDELGPIGEKRDSRSTRRPLSSLRRTLPHRSLRPVLRFSTSSSRSLRAERWECSAARVLVRPLLLWK